jgi:hypothetical protein
VPKARGCCAGTAWSSDDAIAVHTVALPPQRLGFGIAAIIAPGACTVRATGNRNAERSNVNKSFADRPITVVKPAIHHAQVQEEEPPQLKY